MADINAYALGLELQLQINPALKALDTISKSIKDVQKMLADTGDTFKIGGDTGAEKQVASLTLVKNELSIVYAGMAKAYEDAQNAAKAFGSSLVLTEDQINKQQEAVEKATKTFHKFEQQAMKIMDDNKKYKPALEKQIKDFDELSEGMGDLQRSVTLATRKMHDQKAAFAAVAGSLQIFGDSASFVVNVVSALVGKFGLLGVAAVVYANALREIIDMQEVYSKANFRAIGSQEELISATNRLRTATGLTMKQVVESFKALSAAGFKAGDSIDQLAEDNAKFAFVTGISQDATALYQRQIILLMGNVEVAGKQLATFSAIMKQTGVSAQDAQQMVSSLADSLLGLGLTMRPDELKDYTEQLTKFTGRAAQVAGPAGGKALEQLFIRISKSTVKSAKEWQFLTDKFSLHRKASVLLRDAMNHIPETVNKIFSAGEALAPIMAEQMGLSMEEAQVLRMLNDDMAKTGATADDYFNKIGAGANLNKDFTEATKTLSMELQKAIEPIKAWITEFVNAHPEITRIIFILGMAAITAGIVAFAINGLIGTIKSFATGIGKAIELTGKFTGWLTNMGSAAKTTNQASGAGLRSFMEELAGGLKAFADPKAIMGLFVIGGFVAIMTGVVVGVAAAIKELGLSAEDLQKAAFAMLIGVSVLGIAIGLLSLVGEAAIAAAPLLWPLAAVMIALGAAVALAGFGIQMAGDALEKLFKVVLDNAATFLMTILALTFELPAFGLALSLFAIALGLAAPAIVFGMGELFGAAILGLFVAPVFEKLAGSFALIGTALAAIGPRAGVSLISLATGMLAFMAALTGTAVTGAITSFFGLTKDPIVQAKKIADAISMISAPAVSLASALQKVKSVGEAFKPIIDSVLERKAALEEAVATITKLNSKMLAIDKTIKETGFTPPVEGAIPVRQPAITDDTARRVRDQRNQTQMIDNTKNMKASIDKIGDKLTAGSNMKDLIDLLRVWLPKIAQSDKDEGLGSTVNQWM